MKFYQIAFTKAKNKIFGAVIFVFLFALLGFFGCKKDIGHESDNPIIAAQDRSDVIPTVTHGMLHFDSFADLEVFTNSLQEKESDTFQVRNAYSTLGINVYADTLPNLTDYPVCLLKEQSIGGYTSARKAEETIINAALNNGDDNINSLIIFPFWKTALNSDRAVHVGNRIYKYFDNGGVAIVLNNDWTLYQSIKNQSFESLRESFNLIVTSDAREGWDKYFTFNSNESINAEKKISLPRFISVQGSDGNFTISNISLVESSAGSATFKWVYSNNTSSTGQNPNRTVGLNEVLKVIVDKGVDPKDTIYVASPVACSVENFTITYLSNGQIRFELPGYVPGASGNIYDLKWIFSDGTTFTANPVVKTFASNGTVTCQFLYKNTGEVACRATKSFFVKCGDKKSINSSRVFNYCNQRWKLDGSIWVQSGEVGCKVKYLKWFGAILKWKPANNQGACADLSGTYIREVYNPNKNCLDVSASGSHCLGSGTYPTTVSCTISEIQNVYSKPGELSAGLGIKICDVWQGWGYNGIPRLILP